MIYHVSAKAAASGCGTEERPFQTISEAAAAAVAGDTVLVAPGVYREYVNPKNAGTEGNPIVYRSEEPLAAVITGAEQVKGWTNVEGDVWKAVLPNTMFGDYNPYTVYVRGDWYFAQDPVHTGEVYLNGKAMYEVTNLDEVKNPTVYKPSWDPEGTLYKWYTEQEGDSTVILANFRGADPNEENVEINVRRRCFYPEEEGISYITLSGFTVKQAATQWAPPTAYQDGMIGPHWSKGWVIEDCEVSDSRCSGISLGKYLQPNNENKWINWGYKDGTQTERDAICQAQREGWTKENIGSHTIRRCHIHDCGQTGIVGHLGGVFSVIEDNHIHNINNKQDLAGAEIGGIKMHAAIDCIYRRNHIHHCTRGLWLDWQAQGTRVTGNLFHHNVPPVGVEITNTLSLGEDIFVEVSHGPTLIDNNQLLSDCSLRISTQGVALVHNLIAGSFTYVGKGTDNQAPGSKDARFTPYHVPHRTEVAGFMTILHGDNRFYNNIFVQQPVRADLDTFSNSPMFEEEGLVDFTCGTAAFEDYPTEEEYKARFTRYAPMDHADKARYYDHMPVWTGGNVFCNGAKACSREKNYAVVEEPVSLTVAEDGTVSTDVYAHLPVMNNKMITTELLGMAFEPEEKYENPDGTPITFDTDFNGEKRPASPVSGPFAG